MRRTHPPPPPPARAPTATLPTQLQPLWALAVAIAESAAEIAATRPIPSWLAAAYLYAAAVGTPGLVGRGIQVGAGPPAAEGAGGGDLGRRLGDRHRQRPQRLQRAGQGGHRQAPR